MLSRRALLTLWLTVCLDMVGFGIILPVLPFHAERYGASPVLIGWLAAAFSIAQLVAAPALGRLGDRFGRRPVLLCSVAGSCASMLLLALADGLALLFAARLLAGLCGANVATAQAYVVDRVEPSQRAAALGRVGSAIGVGFVLGPTLGGLLVMPQCPSLPFWVAAGLSLGNWIFVLLWLPESRRDAGEPRATRSRSLPSRRTPVASLLLLNLAVFVAFAGMESTFALLLEARLGWGALEAGLLFALIGVTIVLSQGLIVGRTVARIGEAKTLRLGLLTLGLSLAALGVAEHPLLLTMSACAVALGNGLFAPALHALLSKRSDPDSQGTNLGLATSAASVGRVLGPAGAGFVFEACGPGWPSLIGAAIVLALACGDVRS